MHRVSIFAFTLCSWVGDPADFYLHLFQLHHLSHSQLSCPEILLKLPLGAMEISNSLSQEPAAEPSTTVQMMYAPAPPLSQKQWLRNVPITLGGNSFPARNLITILSLGTITDFIILPSWGGRGGAWSWFLIVLTCTGCTSQNRNMSTCEL